LQPATTKCRALRFGVFELDLETQDLRKRGVRFKFAGQSFRALYFLIERAPAVVTREDLCRTLWPGEPWGNHDHGLNKTINRIREALGDSPDNPRFLETLPRVGYRFLVDVERVSDPEPIAVALPAHLEAPAPSRTMPSAAPANRRRFLYPLALAVFAAFSLGVGLAYRLAKPKTERIPASAESTPLTTFLGSELQPAFSPDSRQVAFVWNGESQTDFHLFVMPAAGGAARQLTFAPLNDYGPIWSPDGQRIAFLRRQSDEFSELHIVDATAAVDRKIAEIGATATGHPIAWTSDPRRLVVSARTPGDGPPALFLISPDTGERRRLTSPPVASNGDFSPAISPDGRTLAFLRWTNSSWQDLFILPLTRDMLPAQEPVRLTDLHRIVDTLAWTGDGRALYFSSSRSLAGARFLFRVNATPPANPHDHNDPTDTGIEGVDPNLSPDGAQLVYARRNIEQTSIWRLSAGAGSEPSLATKLISSTRRDFTADISPDGKRLVFSSARTGTTDIWVCDIDGSNLKQVTSFGATTPRWSPDGRKVAVESTRDGQSEIYVIDMITNAIRRLTFDPSADVRPNWSRDGRFIYFSSSRTGRAQIWKVSSEGGEPVQITHNGGAYAVETADGRTLFYVTSEQPASIRSMPVNGGAESPVIDHVVGYSSIALGIDGLYYLASITSTNTQLAVFDFATQRSRQVLSIDRPVHHFLSSPPDGRSILFTRIDREDTDLMAHRLK
jgi:Tol biopolymer transport system component/DNA-binding winged helix-turn-helix (wHTH) protein